MIYFPQLGSGATGQFPIRRRRITRTVQNRSIEGQSFKLVDAGAAITEWHLSYEDLSDQELAAIESLFQACEGRLGAFTFIDPTDNLLTWSESQNQAAWQKDPLLVVSGNIAGPLSGAGAFQITNTGAALQALQQYAAVPSSLVYCFSVYARSDASSRLWLIRGSVSESVPIGPDWTRISTSGQWQNANGSIGFGMAIDPGSSIQIFGCQAEAQPGASPYRKTSNLGGVYQNARFRDDVLRITTVGPNRHNCELDIVNVEHL
ncbi:MAG: hypothetical protein U0Q18_19980 [Bryobacteraceae bacterium]